MQQFADLYRALDATTSTNARVDALVGYFTTVAPADGAWAVYLLTGQRLKRLVGHARLRGWLAEAADLPDWLIEECYAEVGDLAETIALLTPDATAAAAQRSLAEWMEEQLLPLAGLEEQEQRERVTAWWHAAPPLETFLLTKMMTGSLRVGVSKNLVARALARCAGVEPTVILQRLAGDWQPSAQAFTALLSAESAGDTLSQPYPFFLAYALDTEADSENADTLLNDALGPVEDWLAEWKWDGIRAQLIRRGGETYLWSRGEELITERFPEIGAAAAELPEGTVLDGEILGWRDGVLPFADLQKRIGRKTVGSKLLADVPAIFMAFDCLELDGGDLRARPLSERRHELETLLDNGPAALLVSAPQRADSWRSLATLRESARERGVEGFVLKRRDSAYGVGRRRGDWWKWKVTPLTLDAVLIYAQSGHGRRSTLLTDYTFALWDGDTLVPVAKAYSGLTNAEIETLDRWLRAHTRERFGPVRSVEPLQVFEIACDQVQHSSRHKSGIALRFPRILRWRQDLKPEDADTLAMAKQLVDGA